MEHMLIGVDLGTTGCRAIAFDEKLNIIRQNYIEYPLIKITEKMIEQDAALWWELVKRTIRSVSADIPPEIIRAISVSSQGIAFVPVDRDGKPLRNALSWLDMRAEKQICDIRAGIDDQRLFHITGKRANEAYVLPKLLWLRENEGELYKKTYKFLMPHDYIVYKLCGAFVTDHTMASGTLLYDITQQTWSREILDRFDIDVRQLPEIRWSGTSLGGLTQKAAEELGLNRDVVVAMGGQDQKCAALGAGLNDRSATVSLGTAVAITKRWTAPHIDRMMRIPVFSDVIKNNWVTEGVLSTGGVSLKWLKETLFSDKTYDEINDIVLSGMSDADIFFYPHLSGSGSPEWYPNACGCMYGINLQTSKGDFAVALYEGIAFKIKSNLDVLEEETTIDDLIVFGGGGKSEIWCRIISDITGKTVKVSASPEAASRGAAILAGVGCGVFQEPSKTSELTAFHREYHADAARNQAYCHKYRRYCEIEKRLWSNNQEY